VFALVSCHRDLSPGKVVGTTNVINGEWISGSIESILLNGGLVIVDEIDRSMPGFPVSLNSVVSQRRFLRNGEMMSVHASTQFFVTSNTLWGATNEYTAANRQDTAFINRFKVIEWSYDHDFEIALVSPYGAKGKEWAQFVQKARTKAEELGITSGKLSPRQMIGGAEALAKGLKREWVESAEVWDRFSPTDRAKLKAALGK
jgi:MoxR-like ATPase